MLKLLPVPTSYMRSWIVKACGSPKSKYRYRLCQTQHENSVVYSHFQIQRKGRMKNTILDTSSLWGKFGCRLMYWQFCNP